MAVYRIRKDSLYLYEIPLYGSSRLGVIKENKLLKVKTAQNSIGVMSLPIPVNIAQSKNTPKPSVYTMGKKHYESVDWLGNVRVTYTDKKSWNNGKFDLNVNSSQDYYPFGSVMEGRGYNLAAYRYGYTMHERIDEVFGEGNLIDMGDRFLDTRIGRTLKIDKKDKKFPSVSVYNYSINSPLLFKDYDGKEVHAYSKSSQDLILKTLNYVFGEDHGFNFIDNKLVHNGKIPENLSSEQKLLFKYFNEILVQSNTVTIVTTNKNVSSRFNDENQVQIGGFVKEGEASTFFYPAERKFFNIESGKAPKILNSVSSQIEIVITSSLRENGIYLDTEKGTKLFNAEHALLHEFGHAIVYTILTEFKGQFNNVNFLEMSQEQRADWTIRFTNTLLKSKNKPLETGAGQHGRGQNESPNKLNVEPLNK